MNLALLIVGLRPWRAPTSTAAFTRLFIAVSLFSLEAQAATLAAVSIRSLVGLHTAVAIGLVLWWRPTAEASRVQVRLFDAVPALAAALLAALVVTLNLARPLEAADPYHLEKVERIERSGTLRYDPNTERKVNVLNSTYELLLADIRGIPALGPWLIRLHGLLGLALLLVALASTREHLDQANGGASSTEGGARPRIIRPWPWAVLLVIPVVFHQLVLVKNDLFVGTLTLVASAWALTRADTAGWREIVWASWLAGLAVAVKPTTLPIAVVVTGAALLRREDRARAAASVVLGGALGALAGGLVFSVVENLRVYGAPMPVDDIGGQTQSLTQVLVGVPRFALSLVDLGQLTPTWWPGRGGWGSTFGVPLIWALLVLVARRQVPLVRRAVVIAGLQLLAFAAAFQDADLAQRLVLGPGLLLVAVAVHVLDDELPGTIVLRFGLWFAALLSCLQIARSAFLYLRT
jgi:hypothetical protein